MSEGMHRLEFGESTIEYHLSYARRKTLAIQVHPDQRVTVRAPEATPLERVEEIVRRRGAWILRQQREFQQRPPPVPPRQYVSGETHRYLGRQYRLKVEEAEVERVRLTRGRLWVQTPHPGDRERVRRLVEGWYRTQAARLFDELLHALLPRFARWKLPAIRITIRSMKSRWGSCSPRGAITLNLKLMQVPTPYIEYVLAHELCHLVEPNHSPRFYALLDRIMPEWRVRREGLNGCEVV